MKLDIKTDIGYKEVKMNKNPYIQKEKWVQPPEIEKPIQNSISLDEDLLLSVIEQAIINTNLTEENIMELINLAGGLTLLGIDPINLLTIKDE